MESVTRLLEIMARLRDPEGGCPWDQKQTFASIVPHTIEEAYEVADAIENGDFDELKGELGDLLFQVVFYARLAEERQMFDFAQIAGEICDKLVRRHPHVFGDTEYRGDTQLREAWELAKERERDVKGGGEGPVSALDGIAKALPELSRAAKLQKRASRVGFDWPETHEIFFKIEEELAEIHEALNDGQDPEHVEEEVGDLLFAVVNLARHLEIEPETALRKANLKFEHRFRAIEARLSEQGRVPQECSLEELDALWEAVKKVSRSKAAV